MSEAESIGTQGPQTWEQSARSALADASAEIEQLRRANELLRVKCDTVDAMLAHSRTNYRDYAGTSVFLGMDVRYRIQQLLDQPATTVPQQPVGDGTAGGEMLTSLGK